MRALLGVLPGATRPRTPGAPEVSRFITWSPGLPGPDPGHFSLAGKVSKRAPGRPWTPFVCPIGLDQICCCLATEILFLASDLQRVSGPASAVALLKGKMDQPLHTKKYPSSRGPSGEVRSPPHRLRESRRPRSISVAARYQSRSVRLGKKRGSSPKGAGAFSVHFCAYKSEPRGPGLGKPRQ